ncbi:MAG: hypothetical protein HY695_29680 [Deltaproteobacteria bacterium]|nr:hypothetical protein [Deltaproteobacteria bacterium]
MEVHLSGVGVNNPPTGLNVDPFRAFSPSDPNSIQGTAVRFRLSFAGCATSFECHAPDIILFMVFTDGVGFVTPPAVDDLNPIPLQELIPIMQQIIPYDPINHTFRFVIDVGPTPRFLTMGDGDGGVWDNSGQFNIQLFSVVERTVLPPFSRKGAMCQRMIGQTSSQLVSRVYSAYASCLDAEASGRACNPSSRDAAIQRAVAGAERLMMVFCAANEPEEIGFTGGVGEILHRISQSATDAAEQLIRETYPAHYANKP